MLKSEAERIVRKAIEETKAQFTEEQIHAICQITIKIASTVIEEALASWRTGSSSKPHFFAD